jgi:LPS-assembly protein
MRGLIQSLMIGFAILIAIPDPARAQDKASLIADSVSISGDTRLIADGDVQVIYQGQTLRATRIIYDRTLDRLVIEGPLTLNNGEGSFILASQADLSADLTEGVLTSARLVLNNQLQLAAKQIFRVEGRYTELDSTVASSCQVCADNPTPLWEIRAKRVVHDQVEQQLYFENATLRLGGIPVFYLPRLRMPDPTLDRTSGFLTPTITANSNLGTGLVIPYFLTLGPSRDVTIAPAFTTDGSRTLGLRFRQALSYGGFEAEGALTKDNLRPGEFRGFLFGEGSFALPKDFTLWVQLQQVSDPAYLLDYGISDIDRLNSSVEASRTRRNEYLSASLVMFESLREGEINANLPSLQGELLLHRRFSGGPLGGQADLVFETHSHRRESSEPLDLDGDGQADGRDLSRISLQLNWQRGWVTSAGIVGLVMGEGNADAYDIRQDAIYAGQTTRLSGAAAVELRWPWVSSGQGGASQVIEPVVQVVMSGQTDANLPNEDSALVEFDEGNLFSLNRFSGADVREDGFRTNLGVSWTRYDPLGWTLGATLGRVIRAEDLDQFGPSSGLDGALSDWLIAVQLGLANDALFTNRLIMDDDFGFSKAEMRVDVTREKYGLSSSYIVAVADKRENRPFDTSELFFDGSYDLTENWVGKAAGRYDFVADRAGSAGIGLEFRNECLAVDLSLSRRFTSSTNVKPTTDFGLKFDLLGFGSGQAAGTARTCRR